MSSMYPNPPNHPGAIELARVAVCAYAVLLKCKWLSHRIMPWEARWFSADMNKHEILLEWFKALDSVFESEVRDDHYVFAPQSDDVGIKLRQQVGEGETRKPPKLEIKWRRTQPKEFTACGGKIAGFAEEWIKWGWLGSPSEVNDDDVDFYAEFPGGPVLTIGKTRLLRRYQFDTDGIKSVKWIGEGKDGLSCEITEIRVKDSSWWSFGLEGFGTKNNKLEFQTAANRILNDLPIELGKTESLGYPSWIKMNFSKMGEI